MAGRQGRELRAHLQPQTESGESKLEVDHIIHPERRPLLTPPPTYPHQCQQLGPGIQMPEHIVWGGAFVL